MFEKLELIQKRYDEVSKLLARADVATDPRRLQELSKEKADLEDIVGIYQQYKTKDKELAELETLINSHAEEEMTALIKEEVSKLKQQQGNLLVRRQVSLPPTYFVCTADMPRPRAGRRESSTATKVNVEVSRS
jgi:peptide chain release factor 1